EKHADGFEMNEEWYSLKDFTDDVHVLLVQETGTMKGTEYQRPPYPATWVRAHGKGRVFYTSMGHRDDVWASPIFRDILTGGSGHSTDCARSHDCQPPGGEKQSQMREVAARCRDSEIR